MRWTTALLFAAAAGAQQTPAPLWRIPTEGGITSAYRTPTIAPVHMENSRRLDSLLRDGRITLSLEDAISLALENNLDVELVRYAPRLAEMDVLRAEAGSLLRGIPLSVREGPAGLGTPAPGPNGTLGGGNTPGLNALTGPGVQTDLSIIGSLPLSTGPAVPSFDPAIVGTIGWNHTSDPQNSTFLSNLRSLNATTTTGNAGLQQGFSTGGSFQFGWNTLRQRVNNPLLNLNPAVSSSLGVTFTQPLLRGFGPAVNKRYIRIARNNLQVADYVFRQQVIATVSGVVRLYWDLASLNEDVRVRQEAVASAEQFLSDNKNQIETGTVAPVDVTRAQAELSRRKRDLAVAKSLVRQEEATVKDYLTRATLDPALTNAPIVLTDRMTVPPQEPVVPLNDLVTKALRIRPDVAQARLQITNSEISLQGSKNALRPGLDLVASAQNNGLAGRPNAFAFNPGNLLAGGSGGDGFLVGGYGDAMSQLFSRNFPDYGVGLQLTIPLRNRTARADVVRDQLSVREQQIRLQQLEKQVRLEVTNALIAVEQARESYEAVQSERVLQEQVLSAEREKLEVGASTTFYVVQYQRDLAAAKSAEISALASYQKAKAALQRSVGTILEDYSIVMDEAVRGAVSRGGKE
jgi:outer membrane protein TolC